MNFANLPRIYVRKPARFQSFWDRARTNTVRIGILGDSRTTSPGGAGGSFVPAIQAALHARFGNTPETQILPSVGCGSDQDADPAPWMGFGQQFDNRSSLADNLLAPGFSALSYDNASLGSVMILATEGERLNNAALRGKNYFEIPADPSGVTLPAELFAATSSGSGELAWSRVAKAAAPHGFFDTPDATGTTSMGLNVGGSTQFKSETINVPLATGKRYAQVLVNGSSGNAAFYLGVRYKNQDHRGVVVQTFSAGGYESTSIAAAHADCGPMVVATGMDLYMPYYGINDNGNGASAATFGTRMAALTTMVRGWHGDSTIPMIYVSDTYGNSEDSEHDGYAQVLLDLASGDDNAMFINFRRVSDSLWNAGTASALGDGVHPGSSTALKLGDLLVNELLTYDLRRKTFFL